MWKWDSKMATIKEIAELAGVSRGTVDRVLNHRGSVNPKTAQKVNEIARALNYTPNPAGLTLAAQKKKLKLGVILCPTSNLFFAEILDNVEIKARELNTYNCIVVVKQVAFNEQMQLQTIDTLVKEGIHGLALSPVNTRALHDKVNELADNGIPVVTFNTDLPDSKRLAYVGSDYFHAGETAAGLMRLMTHGNTNVGIITGSPDVLCHTERIAGFSKVIEDTAPHIHIIDTVYCHDDEIESYEQTQNLLAAHPEINALFFAAGGFYGGCRAVKALGLLEKLSIIIFDAIPFHSQLLEDGTVLASICQHPEIQGSKPLEILFSYLISGTLPEGEYLYTDNDIRIRENL